VSQLFGAYLIERVGRRRAVCLAGAGTGRFVWLAALALPAVAATALGAPAAPWLLFGVAALSQAAGSLGGVAWLSWMADLVPIGLRGRYFGSRNLICGVATAAATALGGWYLDRFPAAGPPWGFASLFALAVLAGWGSLRYLARIPEPPAAAEPVKPAFADLVRQPFRDRNFRRLVRFSILWNGAVQFASPFFTVYMLESLRVSYTQVAALATLSTVAHLVTIRGWGRLADQYGNRPVMLVTGAAVVWVPLLWLGVDRDNVAWLAPAIHVVGGAAWAGHGLAAGNLLLKLAPRAHNAVYFSAFGALNGAGSALGPVLGGLLARALRPDGLALGPVALDPFGVLFACSFLGRGATLLLLRRVAEPRQTSARTVIRILSTVRGLNALVGFNEAIHLVLVTLRDRGGARPARLSSLPASRGGDYTEGPLRRPPAAGPPGAHDGPQEGA